MLKREPRDWRRCNIAQRLTRLQGSSVRSLAGLPPTLPFPHPARGVFRLCFRAVQVHDLAFFFAVVVVTYATGSQVALYNNAEVPVYLFAYFSFPLCTTRTNSVFGHGLYSFFVF